MSLTPTQLAAFSTAPHGEFFPDAASRAEGEILAELPFFGASEDGIRVPGGRCHGQVTHMVFIYIYVIIIYTYIYIIYIYILYIIIYYI